MFPDDDTCANFFGMRAGRTVSMRTQGMLHIPLMNARVARNRRNIARYDDAGFETALDTWFWAVYTHIPMDLHFNATLGSYRSLRKLRAAMVVLIVTYCRIG